MGSSRSTPWRDLLLKDLADPREAAEYLCEAFQDSPEMFLKALRDVAQVHGMSRVAEQAGIKRESLYRALSAEGNPRLDTLVPVLAALNIRTLFAPNESDGIYPSAVDQSAPMQKATLARSHRRKRRLRSVELRRAGQMELFQSSPASGSLESVAITVVRIQRAHALGNASSGTANYGKWLSNLPVDKGREFIPGNEGLIWAAAAQQTTGFQARP